MPTVAQLSAVGQPAPYADIFDYINHFGMNGASGPGDIGNFRDLQGAAAGAGGGGEGGGSFGTNQAMGGGEGGGANIDPSQTLQTFNYGANSPEAQKVLDKYGEIYAYDSAARGGKYDFSALPGGGIIDWPGGLGMNKGGYSIDQFMPVNDKTRGQLANPNAVIDDPNYGPITPLTNNKMTTTDKIGAMLPYIAASALTGGVLGAIGAPAAVGAGLSAAKQYAMDRTISPTSVLGAAGGIPGLDAINAIMPYVNIGSGIYGASKGNYGAGLGAATSLGRMAGIDLGGLG